MAFRINSLFFALLILLVACHSEKRESENKAAKEIVEQYILDVISGKEYEKLPLLLSEDFVNELSPKFRFPSSGHIITEGLDRHTEHLKALHRERDVTVKILEMVEEDNRVAVLMLVTHSYKDGRKASFPWSGFFDIENGKITKARHIHDTLLEYIQLNEVSR